MRLEDFLACLQEGEIPPEPPDGLNCGGWDFEAAAAVASLGSEADLLLVSWPPYGMESTMACLPVTTGRRVHEEGAPDACLQTNFSPDQHSNRLR